MNEVAPRTAYAAAGVDVAEGDRAVDLLRERLAGGSPDLLGGLGGFAAALPLPAGLREPVLVTATDGVGTKTEIARLLGRYDTIGRDVVAMCADDVVCHAARPAWFLDYLAVGRLDAERAAEIVKGIADACAEIGCRLVGGETAEHPGVMAADTFDLAGFCVGFVERDALLDGRTARAGDAVVGLASSGLHANGYSLVRRLLADGRLTLDDELLEPTRLYATDLLALLDHAPTAGWRVCGLAHVTGGGLAGNLPRAMSRDLGVHLRPDAWPEPAIFGRLATASGMGGAEMRATFNCGVGMAVVVERDAAREVVDFFLRRGIEAWHIGEIRPVDELGGQRYVEAG